MWFFRKILYLLVCFNLFGCKSRFQLQNLEENKKQLHFLSEAFRETASGNSEAIATIRELKISNLQDNYYQYLIDSISENAQSFHQLINRQLLSLENLKKKLLHISPDTSFQYHHLTDIEKVSSKMLLSENTFISSDSLFKSVRQELALRIGYQKNDFEFAAKDEKILQKKISEKLNSYPDNDLKELLCNLVLSAYYISEEEFKAFKKHPVIEIILQLQILQQKLVETESAYLTSLLSCYIFSNIKFSTVRPYPTLINKTTDSIDYKISLYAEINFIPDEVTFIMDSAQVIERNKYYQVIRLPQKHSELKGKIVIGKQSISSQKSFVIPKSE